MKSGETSYVANGYQDFKGTISAFIKGVIAEFRGGILVLSVSNDICIVFSKNGESLPFDNKMNSS